MRAVCYRRYGGGECLELEELEVPAIADDEVLVKVRAASLNPFDWKLRNGLLREHFEPGFPVTPGREGCGDIVATGSAVADPALSAGQRVVFFSSRVREGALAEFVAVRAGKLVVPAPADLGDAAAAALPLAGLSAWNALVETAALEAGMRVLVHGGSGAVGGIAIQIARHRGAEVFATCAAANVARVEALGARAIAYDAGDFADAVADCDVVLDSVGGKVHADSYRVLKKGGRLVYLIAMPFADRAAEFGVEVLNAAVPGPVGNLRAVVELARDGIIGARVGKVLPLADFRRAFALAEARAAGGKVVVTM